MRPHVHSRFLVSLLRSGCAALILSLSCAVMADTINPRWVGVWYSASKQRLGISEQQFNPGPEKCKWVGVRPAKAATCVAFYDGSISKAQLTTQLQQAEKAAIDGAQRKALPAADLQSIKDDFTRNRQALEGLPAHIFRVIKTQASDEQQGSTGCSDYFFLDTKNLYSVMACEAAPEAFTIKTFKRG